MTVQMGTAQAGATDVRVKVTVEAPIEHTFKVFTTRCDCGGHGSIASGRASAATW